MTSLGALAPATLIPAQRQQLWGRLAVANFAGGGLGAGFYLAAAVTADFRAGPSLALASWLGPALVLAGFLAVAAEAGRPLRGPRVLTRIATSWMSRELWAGGAFLMLAPGEFLFPGSGQRLLSALAACTLVLAQGFILRSARAVPAWDPSIMPVVCLVSALVSGTGLLTLVEVVAGGTPSGARLFSLLALASGAGIVWLGYVTWHDDTASLTATRALRQGRAAVEVVLGGYVAPLVLAAIGLAMPEAARAASALAGGLMVVGQAQAKALMILDAGLLRPITVPHLRLDRRPS
ncbi:MAG TPA: DmsC/YnfH family molybdoenzyme membrane anchor subunit [Methylomirabilota bacterium]|jgi:DMSO reductase anchor subunit